jgi:ABC-type sugar transport system ATPase subunit
MSNIQLRNVTKRFGDTVTLHNVNLDIEDGEFAVFVGPSGCGKSTMLRMIAGLEEISDGEVLIGNEVMNDVAPSHRGVAMVFQSYALYPHMTVAENMGYGLKVNKVPKDQIRHQVEMVAKTLQLSHCWTVNRSSSPAASGSVWRSAGPSCATRACLCSMNRSQTWMLNCASRCACIWPACTRSSKPPWCMSPTIRLRP